MSSSSHTGDEAMVSLKVTYEGSLRRIRLPLRNMVPLVFEEDVRTFLDIPLEATAKIERWSDSLGAFVELDPYNAPVYKQLYRAAKAKSKLRLRVSLEDQPELARTIPKPVTVEDDPEATTAATQDTAETVPISQAEHVPQAVSESASHPPEIKETVAESMPSTLPSVELPVRGLPPTEASEPELVEASPSENATRQVEKDAAMPKNTQMPCSFESLGQEWGTLLNDVPNLSLFNTGSSASPSFCVCCNNCHRNVSEAHFHCSTCDDGDFDLCQSCVDEGVVCKGDDHWLIKRFMVDGQLVNSSTETIAPKTKEEETKKELAQEGLGTTDEFPVIQAFMPFPVCTAPAATSWAVPKLPFESSGTHWASAGSLRTCNSCVSDFVESEFLHCTSCPDFDLCRKCFTKDNHGHHPKHAFAPAVAGTKMPDHIIVKMGAGRDQLHHAICDGCDKYISGVRHKCLDCPDWDYCDDCISTANVAHAYHRFVPIYEPLESIRYWPLAQPVHMGICCDGPLCASTHGNPTYIRGVRYKCAVCNDTDFCANCEASPANDHNKTHPLIKFRTPVRHVSVTTTGEHMDGKRMPLMGDRSQSSSRSPIFTSPAESNSINAVQTVIDVKPEVVSAEPSEPKFEDEKTLEPEVEEIEIKEAEAKEPAKPQKLNEENLKAVFLRDSVADGTIFPPNHVFEQTWVLRNEGIVAWPAGCSVKFVGGDYMGHVDSAHPAGISELVSASESTVCYAPLAPGHEFPFTVLLRTPMRAGKIISYWRLTTPDGLKFGHRLWCEVSVRSTMSSTPIPTAAPFLAPKVEEEPSQSDSAMIFPKLENESAQSSVYQKPESVPPSVSSDKDLESEIPEGEDWDGSDGFMTDEEYDILDASDEEYLVEQQRKARK